MTTRQGARRRPADRRLRDDARGGRGARARRPRLDLRRRRRRRRGGARGARRSSTTRRCCAACASWAPRCAAGCSALDGVREVRGRGLMLGVGLERGDRRRRRSAPTCSTRGLVVNVPEPGTLRLLPPLTVDSAQASTRGWPDRRIALKLSGDVSREELPPGPDRSATSAAERLAVIVEAAERAASSVIDDAEEEASRYLDEARRRGRPDRRRAPSRGRRRARPAGFRQPRRRRT